MKIRRKKKMAARCVKKTTAPVKAEAVKAEAVKTEVKAAEVKAEAVKVEEVKAEPAKEAAPKKETAAKKALAKKAEKETEAAVVIQYAGKEIAAKEILERAKIAFADANPGVKIETIVLYVKPEEDVAYYVVNGIGNDDYRSSYNDDNACRSRSGSCFCVWAKRRKVNGAEQRDRTDGTGTSGGILREDAGNVRRRISCVCGKLWKAKSTGPAVQSVENRFWSGVSG